MPSRVYYGLLWSTMVYYAATTVSENVQRNCRAIQINYQTDVTVFQFTILTFIYSSTCFGRFPAHHQELNDCSGSLWFYLRIVVTVVLCSWSGRCDISRNYTVSVRTDGGKVREF
jgi:hypothetical protein